MSALARLRAETDEHCTECCEDLLRAERAAADAEIATLRAELERVTKAHEEAYEILCSVTRALDAAGVPSCDADRHLSDADRIRLLATRAREAEELLSRRRILARAYLNRLIDAAADLRRVNRKHAEQIDKVVRAAPEDVCTAELAATVPAPVETASGVAFRDYFEATAARDGEIARLREAATEAKRRIYNNQPLAAMRTLDAALSPAPEKPEPSR